VIKLKNVDETLKQDQQKTIETLKTDRFMQFIDDTIDELQNWAVFGTYKPINFSASFPTLPTIPQEFAQTETEPIIPEGFTQTETGQLIRDGRKIGRNEPCPCGSGKKYKRCHGKKQ
jgi:uncharacterized protein YecA (UPF0149 family)